MNEPLFLKQLEKAGIDPPKKWTKESIQHVWNALEKKKEEIKRYRANGEKRTSFRLSQALFLTTATSLIQMLFLFFEKKQTSFSFTNSLTLEHMLGSQFLHPFVRSVTQPCTKNQAIEPLFLALFRLILLQSIYAIKSVNEEDFFSLYRTHYIESIQTVKHFAEGHVAGKEWVKLQQMELALQAQDTEKIAFCAKQLMTFGGSAQEEWVRQIQQYIQKGEKLQVGMATGLQEEALYDRALSQMI